MSFNDLEDAEQSVRTLDKICVELPNRREDAEKLADSSPTTRSIRTGIEKITISAPKRLRFLRERLERIEAFRAELVSVDNFCRDSEDALENAKTKNDEAAKQVSLKKRFAANLLRLLFATDQSRQSSIKALCDGSFVTNVLCFTQA